jgi:hypothetical protein
VRKGKHTLIVVPGAKFGRLEVLEVLSGSTKVPARAKCKCECGNIVKPHITSIGRGTTKSCGCLNQEGRIHRGKEKAELAKSNNLVYLGARFGRLEVIGKIFYKKGKDERNRAFVKCKCECGKEMETAVDNIVCGGTKSCGCYAIERLIERRRKNAKLECFSAKHRGAFQSWCNMVSRCYRRDHAHYKNYGGKGIVICKFFQQDARNIPKIIGLPEGDKVTLDRFPDNKGNYTCGQCKQCQRKGWDLNVRWASKKEQCNNKTNNVILEAFGRKQTLAQWSRELGIKQATISARIKHLGWSVEKSLSTPTRGKSK